MTLFTPLSQARERLGLELSADAAALRRAYRRRLAEHPPDRDPEGFRRVREAYELLAAPVAPLRELLRRPLPLVPAPKPLLSGEARPEPSLYTVAALLRLVAIGLELEDLVAGSVATPAERRPRGHRAKPRGRGSSGSEDSRS